MRYATIRIASPQQILGTCVMNISDLAILRSAYFFFQLLYFVAEYQHKNFDELSPNSIDNT